ncbi:MAG: flavin-dependent oxidoreductase, partial [Rhodoblastus sp.]|nr:flavin-dependent oxidoreductase [Rhodoblastus sp.]
FLDHGATPQALEAYEAEMRPATTKVVLTNRTAGPDAILDVIEERCGGEFEKIEDVISREELADHANAYKKIAGFAVDTLNAAPAIIPEGARARG